MQVATGTAQDAEDNRKNQGRSSTTAKTLPKSTTTKPQGGNKGDNDTIWVDTGDNKIPDSTLCQRAHCSHDCNVKNGKAVCSCPDDRFYLKGTVCSEYLSENVMGKKYCHCHIDSHKKVTKTFIELVTITH